jgi:hypothetical protein
MDRVQRVYRPAVDACLCRVAAHLLLLGISVMALVAQALERPCVELGFITTVGLNVVHGAGLHHSAPVEMSVA